MSTCVGGHGPTWPPGMCVGPKSMGSANKRPASHHSGRLLQQVMTQEPYRSARRVFWTMDNGSSHRGQACIDRITEQWPTIVPVHTPVHASWLNQVEIYFSILQRKALTPNDFPSLEALQERLLSFARYYEAIAQP